MEMVCSVSYCIIFPKRGLPSPVTGQVMANYGANLWSQKKWTSCGQEQLYLSLQENEIKETFTAQSFISFLHILKRRV
jgi:hypothetical protein